MFLIGLTGSIGSGKSTVSHIFSSEHSVPVVDADLAARKGYILKVYPKLKTKNNANAYIYLSMR